MSDFYEQIHGIYCCMSDQEIRMSLKSIISSTRLSAPPLIDTEISELGEQLAQKTGSAIVFLDETFLNREEAMLESLIKAYTDTAFILTTSGISDQQLERAIRIGIHDWSHLDKSTSHTIASRCLVALMRIAHQRKLFKEREYKLQYDTLLNLPNKAYFTELFSHHFANAYKFTESNDLAPLMLALIELEGLGAVESSYGKQIADECLITIRDLITSTLGNYDVLAKWSRDTFVLLMVDNDDGVSVTNGISRLNYLISAIEQTIEISGHCIKLNCCAGGCTYAKYFDDTEDMIKACQLALNEARQETGIQLSFFSRSINQAAHERVQLSSALQNAIDKDLLTLFYQPIVIGGTRIVTGAEVLIRWQKTDGSWVPPEQIITLAEELNLIGDLGLWVIESSLKVLGDIQRQGRPNFKMAINLSPKQIDDPRFSDRVEVLFDKYHCSPESIEFELLESEMMENPDVSIDNLKRLRSIGVGISIDDFGSGRSSLEHLRYLPVNGIKIDRNFISDLPNSKADQTVVKAIIGLAHNLRLKVIAVGVENSEQLDFLTFYLNTDDELQGFHFSQALDTNELFRYLRSGR